MKIRLLLGAILVLFGLYVGVYEWILAGLTGTPLILSILLLSIGALLIASSLFSKKKRKKPTVSKETLTIASLLAATVGGIIAAEMLKQKEKSLSNEEILKLETELETLRAQGKVSEEKYQELKSLIVEIKKKRGL